MTFGSWATLLVCCAVAAGVIWLWVCILMVKGAARRDRGTADYWVGRERQDWEEASESETDTESGG